MLQAWFVLAVCGICGMMIGMRLERRRRDAEVDAFELPDTDARHWRKLYEDLAEEFVDLELWDPGANERDRIIEEREDARRETT